MTHARELIARLISAMSLSPWWFPRFRLGFAWTDC
jgi:hypothetical protein